MSITALTELLESVPTYKKLVSSLRNSKISKTQIIDEAVPFLIASIWKDLKIPMVFICPNGQYANRLEEKITAWSSNTELPLRFSESESLPFERLITDQRITQQRIATLSSLSNNPSASPLVITSVSAICQKTLSTQTLQETHQMLTTGDDISLDEILNQWQKMGYSLDINVQDIGTASRRGGILDIYPIGSKTPFRIELWGDTIDSIRSFDPVTQRSIDIVNSIQILPAKESLPTMSNIEILDKMLGKMDMSNCSPENSDRINEEIDLILNGYKIEDLDFYSGLFNHGNLMDYLPENTLVISYRPNDLFSTAWDIENRIDQLRIVKEDRKELPFNFPVNHIKWSDLEKNHLSSHEQLSIMPWGAEDLIEKNIYVLPFSTTSSYQGNIETFLADSEKFTGNHGRIVTITAHSKRLSDLLRDSKKILPIKSSIKKIPDLNTISIINSDKSNIGDGFIINNEKNRTMVLSDKEIFGITKNKTVTKRKSSNRAVFFEKIAPGDYVVHVEHGIAKFIKTGNRDGDPLNQEYLILEYSHSDRLYVPMDHLDRVTPYVAPMERAPSLTRLGTQEWNKTKAKVEKSTKEMASELLELYAERELAKGHAMKPDTSWQIELEDSFPYEETEDQLSTLSEIKNDLESQKPMDRLVCGDVGYGKTEIALRAAFKAAMEGKQVAILVPTTVLAQQHFETFTNRIAAFPINIEVLSRFKTSSEQRNIISRISTGEIDICIGTHRLVQKDIVFKDLGLIIIDEEQRFGVSHKEQLKQMKKQVDVLTLTATPIPRTLHMSLAGVRDMSTIETPPEDRLPIKTYVSEFSDDLIREAILRELDRKGQVYFLHNRVHDIEYISNYIRNLVPHASVGIAHGQLSEGELEKSMIDFSNGDIDVLVCTTIIESGLDIQNANTLIIDRADRFGLSQLYQLRGRIGRGSKRAFSYLLIPKATSLTEAAERRLKAMLSATELGSGFKIAMKDLEIRGAGNILGAEQSGHIHAVGFELYTRLLNIAVEDLRSAKYSSNENDSDTMASNLISSVNIDLKIPAGIPESYIKDLSTRLDIYQKISKVNSITSINDISVELNDRFGPLPWETVNLLYISKLKVKSSETGIELITRVGDKLIIQFAHQLSSLKLKLSKILGNRWTIGNMQIRTPINMPNEDWEILLDKTINELSEFNNEMKNYMST